MSCFNNRLTFEPFSASQIGRTIPEFVIGKHSGTASIKHILQQLGYWVSQAEATILLNKLRALSNRKKGACTIEELKTLYQEIRA